MRSKVAVSHFSEAQITDVNFHKRCGRGTNQGTQGRKIISTFSYVSVHRALLSNTHPGQETRHHPTTHPSLIISSVHNKKPKNNGNTSTPKESPTHIRPQPDLGRNAQGRVESISGSLARLGVGGGGGIITGADGVGAGLALGLQLPADETRDDLDVEGAAVVEVGRVGGRERLLLAAVEPRRELDGRVAAGAKVELGLAGAELAELLGAGGGVAGVLCCGSES